MSHEGNDANTDRERDDHDHSGHWTRCPLCKDRPPYEMEHADFTMPEEVTIPEGFVDYSWHNDEYPRWAYKPTDMDVYHAQITIMYERYEGDTEFFIKE